MKKFLQNMLIGFSLLLCGVIVLQWMREANLRAQNKTLAQEVFTKAQAGQQLENSLKTADAEVKRLDARIAELTTILRTNETTVAELRRSLRKAEIANETLQKQRTDFEEALARQNQVVQKQNKDITEQNTLLKKLAGDRNEAVEKLNQRTQEYNGLVTRFNELAKRLENPSATQATQ
jgi:chromosome segregation ATPase